MSDILMVCVANETAPKLSEKLVLGIDWGLVTAKAVLADNDYPLLRLLVTPSDAGRLAELGALEVNTPKEINATYKTDY
ncbi:hypothetical protein LPJ81_001533 [Coemansia sp. IMI 209127]|nr:hypothetical protein LPJ81_001533 [Coemansia sp. IMI 209127]